MPIGPLVAALVEDGGEGKATEGASLSTDCVGDRLFYRWRRGGSLFRDRSVGSEGKGRGDFLRQVVDCSLVSGRSRGSCRGVAIGRSQTVERPSEEVLNGFLGHFEMIFRDSLWCEGKMRLVRVALAIRFDIIQAAQTGVTDGFHVVGV